MSMIDAVKGIVCQVIVHQAKKTIFWNTCDFINIHFGDMTYLSD